MTSEQSSERLVRLVDGPCAGEIVRFSEPGSWIAAPFGSDGEVNYEVCTIADGIENAEFRGFSQR